MQCYLRGMRDYLGFLNFLNSLVLKGEWGSECRDYYRGLHIDIHIYVYIPMGSPQPLSLSTSKQRLDAKELPLWEYEDFVV